jgi:hypothetical protein
MQRNVLHLPEADWYPFFRAGYAFTDLTIHQQRFRHFGTASFFQPVDGFVWAYPAPLAFIYRFLFLFGPYAVGAFCSLSVLIFATAGVWLGRAIRSRGASKTQTAILIGSGFLLSYPFWFLFERANVEMINWLLIALGVAAYWNKRWYSAGAGIGIAISLKIYPFVFLGLLLSARKYRAIVWALIVCAVTSIMSTWILGPTFSIASSEIAKGIQDFQLHYTLQVNSHHIGFDHSLFAVVKLLTFQDQIPQEIYYLPILHRYMLITAVAGLVLYFWKIWKLPRTNQILALTIASILLPPVSYEYTLIDLYIPWAALVLLSVPMPENRKVPGLVFTFACLAFLMAPMSYLTFHGVHFGGQLKSLAMLLLFLVALTYPFPESELQSKPILVGEAEA